MRINLDMIHLWLFFINLYTHIYIHICFLKNFKNRERYKTSIYKNIDLGLIIKSLYNIQLLDKLDKLLNRI